MPITTSRTNGGIIGTSSLLAFLVLAAYWPGIAGPATTPRWIVLFTLVPLLLFFADRVRLTLSHVAGLAFIAWCAVTLMWSVSPLDGIGALAELAAIGSIFALGSLSDDLTPLYRGAAVGIGVSSVLVIGQWLHLIDIPAFYLPAGLFVNANHMGEAAALVLVACLFNRIWWGVLASAPALLLSGSRAAVLAVAISCMAWLWANHLRATAAVCCVLALWLAVAAFFIVKPDMNGQHERLAIWSDTARNLTFAGAGIGSYWEAFPDIAVATDISRVRPEHAHNEFLDIAFETGAVGFLLFLAFAATLWGPFNVERAILIAVLVEASFAFPFSNPATTFLGSVAAGAAARSRRDIRSEVVAGRDRIRAWLAAGKAAQTAV